MATSDRIARLLIDRTRRPGYRFLLLALTAAIASVATAVVGLGILARRDPVFLDGTLHWLRQLAIGRFPAQLVQQMPWQLGLARIALPFAIASVLLACVVVAARRPVRSALAAYERDHVVVCGPGESAATIAGNLIAAGRRVVVLRPGETPAGEPDSCITVDGDGTIAADLRRVSVGRARALIAASDDDQTNLVIARTAQHVRATEGSSETTALRCVALIDSASIRHGLRMSDASVSGPTTDLRLFSYARTLARLALAECPLDSFADVAHGQALNILMIGLFGPGEDLLCEIMALGHYRENGLSITIVAPAARQAGARLRDRCPEVDAICTLEFVDLDPVEPWRHLGAVLDRAGSQPLTSIFVSLDSPDFRFETLSRLPRMLRETANYAPPVYVHDPEGLQVDDAQPASGLRVVPFGSRRHCLTEELLLGDALDARARAIHETYLRENPARPGNTPWEALPESLREANRRQADHALAKLHALGCSPRKDDGSGHDFTFEDTELKVGARLEHQRWMAERRLDGWVRGQTRDDKRRRHDCLIPFDDLTPKIQKPDFNAVAIIPSLLRMQALSIARDLLVGVVTTASAAMSTSDLIPPTDSAIAKLAAEHRERRIVVLCPLLDGSSMDVVERCLSHDGVALHVPLSMPVDELLVRLPKKDAERFTQLLQRAERTFPLPLTKAERDAIKEQEAPGTSPFERATAYVVARSHVMLLS